MRSLRNRLGSHCQTNSKHSIESDKKFILNFLTYYFNQHPHFILLTGINSFPENNVKRENDSERNTMSLESYIIALRGRWCTDETKELRQEVKLAFNVAVE